MTLNVKGVGLGAQVTGIDPDNLADISTDELRRIVYDNKLVILKDVNPSPERFIELGRILGEIVTYYEPVYHHKDHPEIFVSSTEEGQGVPRTGAFWHIDYMFMPEPFAFSMVMPLAVPGTDRGTYFIDLNKVWESLPAARQDSVRGTFSTHDPRRHIKIRPGDVYKPIGEVWDEINRTTPPVKWPTVIRHPYTDEEILYICSTGTDHRGSRMCSEIVPGDVVEHQRPQCGRLVHPAEVLVVVVEGVPQGDGHRVVDDAVGPRRLRGSLVQGEQSGFRYPVEMAGVDCWHGITVRPTLVVMPSASCGAAPPAGRITLVSW